MNSQALIWPSSVPAVWPDVPTEMTVTVLGAIESCPRRWALGAAHYPELWSGRGYPPRVQLNALSGTVVHLALEVITSAFINAGCQSPQDPTTLRVMKDLGGYTKVLNDCIDRTLELLAMSPRAQPVLEYATRSLRAQVPELRTRAQTMLCRRRLHPTQGGYAAAISMNRAPLRMGAFPELTLRARHLGWKGKVDLLVLSEEGCEIIDFKTGAPGEHHEFQIRVYALLWSRDAELNPGRRSADRLVLSYGHGDVEVAPPSGDELDDLEGQLVARTAAALAAMAQRPPEAKPDPGQCPFCDVRHICTAYWSSETQRLVGMSSGDRHVADATVAITGPHGPSSWDGLVVSSAIAKQGQRVLLRADNRSLLFAPRQIARVLSAHFTATPAEVDSESVLILTLGASSEVYLVP